jgi:hypothetical protein
MGANSPIGGVLDTGQLQSQTGDSQGTESLFAGKTDLTTGIDDHPDVITDAVWNLQSSWDDVQPACDEDPTETNKYGVAVPLNGYLEQWICVL